MGIPDAVVAWFDSLRGTAPETPAEGEVVDDPSEGEVVDAPAEVVEVADTPADSTETPEPVGLGENPSTEPDKGTGPGVDDQTGAIAPTLPAPTSDLTDEQRDQMNLVAAENESLRSQNDALRARLAELGGDAALGVVEEPVTLPGVDDTADEYDAEADIAEQLAEIARLKGDNTEQKD